jgi:predicted secreted hydrolase
MATSVAKSGDASIKDDGWVGGVAWFDTDWGENVTEVPARLDFLRLRLMTFLDFAGTGSRSAAGGDTCSLEDFL